MQKFHIKSHMIRWDQKKKNVNKNGLKLIFFRDKEMFQQYLFSLSNHQACTLSSTVFKLSHSFWYNYNKAFLSLHIIFF